MIHALHIPVIAGFLVLASAEPNGGLMTENGLYCTVPAAPAISITPISEDIQYDYSHSSRELTAMKDGPAQSAINTDVATGGLRVDQPVVAVNVRYGVSDYRGMKQACIWYTNAEVTITLRPHIYIAREYNLPGPCRDAILAHELRHVDVDREMMNKYSYVMGEEVRKVINAAGGVGPFDDSLVKAQGQGLIDKVSEAVRQAEIPLRQEMKERQAEVDSPAEYHRVSVICYGATR